jgi:hypothetical protein
MKSKDQVFELIQDTRQEGRRWERRGAQGDSEWDPSKKFFREHTHTQITGEMK